ncbi:TetR/AcrR family transcriptional regulator [Antrihabitans spumae]|uniref:TetR/AcrR family transcriptional regulator n=1 Tax=Antrihabitans spumae TaxID=3373370 RepID=A0ABW7K4B4_9NOCA
MRTVDPQQHAKRRLHILDAAAECFADKGFAKTTTAKICSTAGISSGSLFHYFPNKQAVFSAIFEQDRSDLDEFFTAAAQSDDPYGCVIEWIDHCAEQARLPIIAGLMAAVVERCHQDPVFAELVTGTETLTRDGIATLIEKAERIGQLEPTASPHLLAGWVLVLVDGLYSRLSELGYDRDLQLSSLKTMVADLLGYRGDATANRIRAVPQ